MSQRGVGDCARRPFGVTVSGYREEKKKGQVKGAYEGHRPPWLNLTAAHQPEVLCAVLLRELLWLEARMDVQALFEGSVVLSDEDGPARTK